MSSRGIEDNLKWAFEMAKLTSPQVKALRRMGFLTAPASRGHHLACMGGLAQHSFNVVQRLAVMTDALEVEWSRPSSPYLVGLLHDLVKCQCYQLRDDAKGWEYHQPGYPGHGVASVMIATVELGIKLNPDEAAAITWHMGAFGLCARDLDEFDAALARWPGQIIATHTADWAAARLDESGDWSDMRGEVSHG